MKCNKSGKEITRDRSAASGKKGQEVECAVKAANPELDLLSADALIRTLRGSCKGPTSLVKALQQERRRDERIESQKLKARGW